MGKLSSLQKPQKGWELLLMAMDNSRSNAHVKVFSKADFASEATIKLYKRFPSRYPSHGHDKARIVLWQKEAKGVFTTPQGGMRRTPIN